MRCSRRPARQPAPVPHLLDRSESGAGGAVAPRQTVAAGAGGGPGAARRSDQRGCAGIIPPPFPFTAFVVTSGALRVNRWKFLTALAGAPGDPVLHRRGTGGPVRERHPGLDGITDLHHRRERADRPGGHRDDRLCRGGLQEHAFPPRRLSGVMAWRAAVGARRSAFGRRRSALGARRSSAVGARHRRGSAADSSVVWRRTAGADARAFFDLTPRAVRIAPWDRHGPLALQNRRPRPEPGWQKYRPEWKMENGKWQTRVNTTVFPSPICHLPLQDAFFSPC